MDVLIKIETEITIQEALDFIHSPACGGEVVFTGKVRNDTKGRAVTKLFYESYKEMAIKEMEKIAIEVENQWPIHKIALLHAVGDKLPGDVAVVVAVSSVHRGVAFDACEYAIDTLKAKVPIWKKEFFADGEVI
ncbi:molybdenum cofactor biosynthesis protein MoaE [Chitinophaga sp. Cy-1792]|uniref:molybdenum cofactor biosynthesis protein MoaE n=1 Tax=Chitinophaga sp. Cy-1792 TaxID=2608339 RepID=UPI001421D7EF|nr:molybdenum cofactor biosynthesis protein MoaE [Chitinophaga sp. Cy-1792]NIG52895.1 molybdenum cofactor biosynthesis protein MoaE [Chitinophaga sp. Cy-1792]